ncbi:MAG: ABC transporter substrate-binding protein [Egibacteraceae bacterium]
MTRRGIAAIVATALLAALSVPAAGATESGQFPMTIENCGREVTIPQAPERVLVMGGEAATLVWAAGAADRITTYASFEGELLGPAEAALEGVPTLPASGLSKELIIGQQPDVVITYGLDETTPEDLAEAGIQTIIISGFCINQERIPAERASDPFERIYASIELYGQLFGTQDQAAQSVADLRERVAAVEERERTAPVGATAATVYVPDEGPLSGYGSGSMAHSQMNKLGFANVFAGPGERYFELSVEELIAADPDVLIAQYGFGQSTADSARDRLLSSSELSDVTAIRNDAIVALVYDYSGGGALAVDGLEIMAEQLAALQ